MSLAQISATPFRNHLNLQPGSTIDPGVIGSEQAETVEAPQEAFVELAPRAAMPLLQPA